MSGIYDASRRLQAFQISIIFFDLMHNGNRRFKPLGTLTYMIGLVLKKYLFKGIRKFSALIMLAVAYETKPNPFFIAVMFPVKFRIARKIGNNIFYVSQFMI
jgi:hypothetical protein